MSLILHDCAANDVRVLPILFALVIVGARADIGVGAIVMCGTPIGERVIVGAASLVTRDNPARYIASLEEYSNGSSCVHDRRATTSSGGRLSRDASAKKRPS